MKKVLVVDDSEFIRQQVSVLLEEAGFNVQTASDGMQGLDTIKGEQDIALVICDVNMPRMDGMEMLSEVRKAEIKVPVVMLTTEGDPDLIDKARSLGATGWLVKPYKTDHLLKVVSTIAS